jgi:DNA-binding CsgD family transcriptional regulator/tetratricopeptide (TPR) repeat protein
VELVEADTGIAILGSAGVGKSRLLNELVDRAERNGKVVVRAAAAEATRSIAFAPFTELLPASPTQDRLAMLGMALRALRERSGQRGLLLAVDDAHHLDEASLALLIQVVSSGAATLALTARSGEAMSPDLVDLWTNGAIERIDLEPLDRSDCRLLIEETLGPMEGDLEEELWRLAGGNPLVLHELIEGARDHAIIRDETGAWTRRGQLSSSPRLADLVASRLKALPEELRLAMDVVAVGAPLPNLLLAAAVGDATGRLEERGLITEVESAGEPMVAAAHPLYGEILKQNLSQSRQRHAFRQLVEAVVNAEVNVDPLRAAVWQREAGLLVSPELALRGASAALARHDARLGEELVRMVPEGNPVAGLLLGRALNYQQRFEEAESVLVGLDPDDPDLLGEIASARAQNMGFGLGEVSAAREILAAALDVVDDPQLRGRLMNERAMVSAIKGDFVDARLVSEQVLSDPRSNDVSRVAAYVTLTISQAMTGDCDGLDSIIDDAVDRAGKVRDELPFAVDQIQIMNLTRMVSAGRTSEGIALAEDHISRAGRGNVLKATWLNSLCLPLDIAGRHDAAAEAARQAIDLYSQADPFGLEAQARGLLALQLGQQGDTSAAKSLEGLVLNVPAPRLTVWVDRGRAWSMFVAGENDEAIRVLINAGRHAVAGEHFVWGAFCFHDVARLGQPGVAAGELRGLPAMSGADLVDNMREQVEALVAGQEEALGGIAERFLSFGAFLLAAETWAESAGLLVQRGNTSDAARCALLSMTCERRCEDSHTPALRDRPTLVSSRESQVAMAAAAGLTSAEIGKREFISVRTVDNHLRSVYRKLGIGGREELRSLMAPALRNE